MSMSELLSEGYRFYKATPLSTVDCVALRGLDDHARGLKAIIEFLGLPAHKPHMTDKEIRHEWTQVEQWLGMAAGLRFVDIEFLDGRDSWLCSVAGDYNDAHNSLVSAYATEQNRLLYVWSAAERLLKLLILPDNVPDKFRNNYNRASSLLTQSYELADLPEHYMCVYEHLCQHVQNDTALQSEKSLSRSLLKTSWRREPGLLLSIGNSMRNIPAHGVDTGPAVTDWDRDDPRSEVALSTAYHAPMLATRGLLLSIQMLLATSCQYFPDDLDDDIVDGRWVRAAGKWEWVTNLEPALRDIILSAHLRNPDEFDDGSM